MPLFTVTGGMGAAVDRWAHLSAAEIERAALDAAEDVGWGLVAEIEAQAAEMPNERWGHVAGFFEPVRTEGNVGVWIHPDHPEAREAFDLEYGQVDRAPLPVMRSSITAVHQDHSRQWSAAFHQRLFGG